MRLARGSDTVWPGYVAAVASLLLSLLMLAGVLVVAISQIGRVVGSYNRQLLSEIIQDERRAEELEQLDKKGQALASATVQAQAQAQLQAQAQAQAQALAQARASAAAAESAERSREQALNSQLRQKEAELAAAQAELARLELLTRQASVARGDRRPDKILRFSFGAGAPGLEDSAVHELRAALSRDELLQRRWMIEAGAKGVSVVASREIFRLMLALRTQLQEMGLPTDQVRLVLNQDRSPQDFSGPLRAGDIVIVLRPDGPARTPS